MLSAEPIDVAAPPPTSDSEAPLCVALNHADPHHKQVLLVDWMLGNRCSFACEYCPPALHNGSLPWIGIAAAVEFLDALKRHYIEGLGRTVWLQLTGGEPTQYPRFFDLCSEAHSRGIRVGVISNGSRTARFWEKASGALSSVILTYHDAQASHSGFLATIEVLTANEVPLHINVTVHPDRFDDVLEKAGEIRAAAKGGTLTLKPLRVDFGDTLYPYTDSQLQTLAERIPPAVPGPKRSASDFQRGVMVLRQPDGAESRWRANDLILKGRNRWRGMRCHAGLESLRVKADGSVYRSVCGVGGQIGQIGGEIDFPVVAITCDRDSCACVADILITKSAPYRHHAT